MAHDRGAPVPEAVPAGRFPLRLWYNTAGLSLVPSLFGTAPRAWILDIYFIYFKKKTKALICFFEKERLFGKDEEKSGEDIGEHPAGF